MCSVTMPDVLVKDETVPQQLELVGMRSTLLERVRRCCTSICIVHCWVKPMLLLKEGHAKDENTYVYLH